MTGRIRIQIRVFPKETQLFPFSSKSVLYCYASEGVSSFLMVFLLVLCGYCSVFSVYRKIPKIIPSVYKPLQI